MTSNVGIDSDRIPIFQDGIDTHVLTRSGDGHVAVATDRTAEAFWASIDADGQVFAYPLPSGATWLVDGVLLDDPFGRWYVDDATNWPTSSVRRVATLTLPLRNGVVSRRQGWDTGIVKLGFTVNGGNVDGQDEARLALVSLVARARELTYRHGERTRTVDVVKVEVSEPEILDDPSFSRLEATFTTQPFWHGIDVVTSTDNALSAGTVTFGEWAGCTGPVSDAVVRLTGPFDQLTLAGVDGSSVSFASAATAGSFVFFDAASFTAWSGGASQWAPSSSQVLVDYGPAGPLQIDPSPDGSFRLTVAGSAFTAASKISLRGRKWWL